ncbi:integrase, catalytic region, zinc finger, CCHC-type containing protein [Tanacetum coccineum]
MTTLAEHIIVAGAENHPPMLEKSMYDSWASRIRLFIKGEKHGRMMLDSIDNGPLVYPTVEENGQTRPKKYFELTEAQQLQDDCDVQATNIILHALPPDVLYNLFDNFAHVPGETLYEYYWRFSQLINEMHTIRMTMQQVQVNTKFLIALPSEWSKFVTDVKLAKSLYTTNYDQLYAYLSQHERHANEVRINRERYLNSLAFVANSPTLYNPSQSLQHSAEFPQFDFGLAVPMFQQGEDLIKCINKAMAFLSAVALRFPPSKNQLRTSSNPRNQATIHDVGQSRVVKCYNCQGEGHMARQCTQPKRPRNATWFKEKLMLAEAQEAGQILNEEQLSFLADPDCDDLSSAKAVLMANLLSCDPGVLSEVPYSESYPNDMINQDVQEMQYSEQTHVDDTHKQALGYQNPFHLKKALRIQPRLYDGSVIAKEHVVISVNDDEETLILEVESRSKILDKQNDPISIENKIKISPIDYSKLNKIKEDFGKRFITQKELSAEQAFWLKHSSLSETPVTSHTPVRIEAPKELPKRKKQIEQRPPLSVRSSRSSSPTKPTTPCSSLSALAGKSLRTNVGLDRGIKTSSIGRERIGESVIEMKAGDRTVLGPLASGLWKQEPTQLKVDQKKFTICKGNVSSIRVSKQISKLAWFSLECTLLHSAFRCLWRTKEPLGAEGKGDLKTTNATISLNCLDETPRTTRIEDVPLVRKHNGLVIVINNLILQNSLKLFEADSDPSELIVTGIVVYWKGVFLPLASNLKERLPPWHSSAIQSWEGHRILLLSAGERDNQRRDKVNVTMNEDRC